MTTCRLLCKLLACCFLLLWWVAGQAAPAAGVVISNTATATFVDAPTGISSRLNSNTVHTRVTALEAVTLTASQSLLIATGATFNASHTLTNTGNVDATFRVAASVPAGSSFAAIGLQVVHDVNGNGRIDPGEPAIGPAGIALSMGASATLVLTGQAPVTATAGQSGQVVLTATSVGQGAQASNTDTLTVTSGAAVQATLAASTSAPVPGGTVDWTAVAVNNGSAAAAPLVVLVDGGAVSAFVLRVPVPVNTRFVSASPASNVSAATRYHLVGAPVGSYVSAVPAGAAVDAVAWMLPDLPAGGSLQGQFRVQVNDNAAGVVSATAQADWSDAGTVRLTSSNPVVLPLPGRAAQIRFYTSSAYAVPAAQNTPGRPLFVQADAAVCNAGTGAIDTVPVTVTSQLTGDVETFTGVETGPNTGLFRIQPEVPTANAATHTVVSGDGILEVLRNDVVTATITTCGGGSATASTTLLIDPSGVVYDARSNLPLAGATVELIDVTGAGNGGRPGQAAVVLALDGVTPAPSTVVTGADGVYAFPLVQPSTYRLRVTPPAGFTFPSVLPAALQPASRTIDTPGSYGGNFSVVLAAVRFDVPLDTGGTGGLTVQKVANRSTAEVGDFVDYTVTVRNVMAVPLHQVLVRDALPAGFMYVAGTARLAGQLLTDPAGAPGPQLAFNIGRVEAGSRAVLTYRLRVGAGSQNGTGINTAQAMGQGMTSNRATARVLVLGGVFSTDGYVIGKVYADCSRDGLRDAGEPGVPGVRIYLEDGTYAITDEEGKYSLYGLSPRTHVAKVDTLTLPAGATLRVLDNRNARDAGSRFLDLKNGELHQADFAIAQCDAGVREQIAARRKALQNPAEIAQAANVLLSPSATSGATDARTLPATGGLGLPGSARTGSGTAGTLPDAALPGAPSLGAVGDTGGSAAARQQGLPQPIYRSAAALLEGGGVAAAIPAAQDPDAVRPLEDLLPQMNPETGFVAPRDGQILPTAQTRVRVKGPFGASFELLVNGQPVPASQVGKRSSLEQVRVTAWEYIGVDLRPGRNALEVKVADGFGNVRGRAQITVIAPGPLAAVRIGVPERPVADAATPVPVTVSLRDAEGVPVTARTQLTLSTSAGLWQVADADPRQNGIQVLLEGGTGQFMLLPPAQPGKAELAILAGTAKGTATVEFVPNLRPMIAAGVVEGTINLRNLNPAAVQPVQSGDVFEREIRAVSRSFSDGKGEAGARAALFLKGKVLGSSLLTVAYDSDKASDTRLFRDIQPNQFYPVYGDSSARGYDGQSSGKLYVLLQNGSNYALVGDFLTQGDSPARQLTQYARALNGAKGRWSDGTVQVEGFASRTSATQLVQEFRANGTSGPFNLNAEGVVNSEQVHVIVRDRDQSSVVRKDTPLVAFTDYTIEPYSGVLLLKEPVPSVDADLNPVFIRISYDIDGGGPRHTVAGVEASVEVAPGTRVGALVVRDDDPANRQTLQGVTLTSRIGQNTAVAAEVARSRTDLKGEGQGARVDVRHDGPSFQAHVWGVRTDAGFQNTGSPQTGGQSEYGAKAGYTIDARNRVVAEALRTSNTTTGVEQTGAELKLEHALPGNAKLEAGVRHSSTDDPVTTTGQEGYTSARLKLTVPVPGVPEADMYALVEHAIDGSDGREVGIGANYAVGPGTRLYLRHDFTNSLGGAYSLNADVSRYTTVAGVNTVLPGDTQLFNEYRMGDAIDGRTAEAAIGLRRTLRLPAGLNVTASLQRIKPIAGPQAEDSSAVALGAEYTAAADWKASGQVQWQTSTASSSWLLSGAVVNKLDRDVTLLNRFLYSDQASNGASGGNRKIVTAQSGVAVRPNGSDDVNALARIEYKREQDTTVVQGTDQSAWILSTHLSMQPQRHWLVNARYAARLARDRSNGLESRSFTQLLGGRVTWDVTERWDVGLQAYSMWGDGTRETAVGLEVGYLAWENLWVSVGYNFIGFSARDLAGDATTTKGAYVRLRYKFDESLLGAERPEAGTKGSALQGTTKP